MPDQALVEKVRQAWAEVLDTDTAPLEVNFFDAGGDSVLLVVLLERLNELTGRKLEPPDLFRHSTVLAQAALLAGDPEPAPDIGTGAAPAGPEPEPDRRALLGRGRAADA